MQIIFFYNLLLELSTEYSIVKDSSADIGVKDCPKYTHS